MNPIYLSRRQVREVDRRAIEEYGIPGVVLMENAGRGAANIIEHHDQDRLAGHGHDRFVAIVCGSGNNGGDGWVIARHLSNAHIPVEIFAACDPARLTGDAAVNYRIAQNMKLSVQRFNTSDRIDIAKNRLQKAAIIVDAVLGTGFHGQVRTPLDRVIGAINNPGTPPKERTIIAVDLPSGLDCDSGLPSNATVCADLTLTFVGRKMGFAAPGASVYIGKVHVIDIGAPEEIVHAVLSEVDPG